MRPEEGIGSHETIVTDSCDLHGCTGKLEKKPFLLTIEHALQISRYNPNIFKYRNIGVLGE